MKKLRVALVYDRVNKWGGAERVLLALHEIFPKAPLYTSVYDPKGAPWAKVFPEIVTSFLQKVPFAKSNHEFFAPLMPKAFESFNFSGFDLVISVTSEAAKGIKVGSKTKHICYCLTPTRYLWSHYDEYFKGATFKGMAGPIINFLRKWDKKASKRPHAMVAISTEVKNRIKKYYKRDAEIIFPPVDTSILYSNVVFGHKIYYLLVSRLDYGYKKVELAIKAFNKSGKPLVIVGDGREKKKLQDLAKKNIKFAGRVTEANLKNYYKNAKALIMPQEEDFGIVAVEAQSFGIPVIAYKNGGALDTVISGKTGIFFEEQKPESLNKAVKRFENLPAGRHGMKFDKRPMIANAKSFSKARFKKEFLDFVKKMLK